MFVLKGKINTSNSPELEEKLLKELPTEIDAGGLEYISSSGLRVLLSAQKTMKGKGTMVVKNVSELVMEVFEITGFVDILTIE